MSKRKNTDLDIGYNGNSSLAKRSKLNPDAKEFVPACRSSSGWSWPVHKVIKDELSDGAFIQRLIKSRKYWGFPERPSYEGRECAWCDDDPPSESEEEYDGDINDLDDCEYTVSVYGDDFYRHSENEIMQDMFKIIAYYLNCEDKSKKHECKLCIEWYINGEKEKEDHYYCPDPEDCDCHEAETSIFSDDETSDEDDDELSSGEDDEASNDDDEQFDGGQEGDLKRKFVYAKRSQKKLFKHISERHKEKMKVFFFEHQDIIPSHRFDPTRDEWGYEFRDGDCQHQYGFEHLIEMMEYEVNLQYLNMEKPKTPPPPPPRRSPRSPKWYAWWDQ